MSMDVNGISGIVTSNYLSTNDSKKVDIKNNNDSNKIQGPNEDILKDTFVKSTEHDSVNLTYKPVKNKLTTEEIKAIKEEQENSKAELIKRFISDTINSQNKLLGKSTESGISEMPKETSDLLIKIFGSVENAYPPMATTQEGAQAAIAEGGHIL